MTAPLRGREEDAEVLRWLDRPFAEQARWTESLGLVRFCVQYLANPCEGRCFFCGNSRSPDSGRTPWAKIEEHLTAAPRDADMLCLVGDEPLLHPDFPRAVSRAASAGFRRLQIMTSGLALERREVLEALRVFPSVELAVPIYSRRPQIHDRVFGAPAFERLVRSLDAAKAAGHRLLLHSLVLKQNLPVLAELCDWARQRWDAPVALAMPRGKPDLFDYAAAAPSFEETALRLGGRGCLLVGFPACVVESLGAAAGRPPDVAECTAIYFAAQTGFYPPCCGACVDREACPGVVRARAESYGEEGLRPRAVVPPASLRLLNLIKDRGITDAHFRADAPAILRRGGQLVKADAIQPLSGAQIEKLAVSLMNESQRKAFAGKDEMDFSTDLPGLPKFKVRLATRDRKKALTLRDVDGRLAHPSLAKPPVKRHWVRLTRVCNDHCSFCLDKEAQDGTNLPFAAIAGDLDKGRHKGLTRVVLSGGEPTIHPQYVEIVAKARELGYTHIQTVTNGRRMCYPQFLDDCVKAGLSEVTFSLHGHTPALHDSQTGSPGSFLQGLVALRHALKIPGLIVSVDIVISRKNVRHLRETMDFFVKEGVREFDLLQVIPFGSAWQNKEELFYDVEAELPHLQRALDLSKRGDIVIWTNRLPTRYLEGYEDLIQPPGKLHDEYAGRGLMFEAFLKTGAKPDCWGRCPHCFLKDACRDIADLREKGSLEGRPAPKCLEDHPDVVLREREPGALEHRPELSMKEFVDFYIQDRYFIKGRACRSCKLDDSCAGAHVEHVRRYGFPKPKPWMTK